MLAMRLTLAVRFSFLRRHCGLLNEVWQQRYGCGYDSPACGSLAFWSRSYCIVCDISMVACTSLVLTVLILVFKITFWRYVLILRNSMFLLFDNFVKAVSV